MSAIYHEEFGEGYPLVFIHGFCETNYVWKELAEILQKDFKVIIPDLPGFGKSPLPKDFFSIDDIAAEVKDWLKTINIDKCCIFGHSLGGYVVLSLARQFPGQFDGFGLCNSSVFADSEEKKENRNKLIQHVKNNGVKSFIQTFVPSLFYPERAQEFEHQIRQIRDFGMQLSPDSVAGYAAAMRDRPDSSGIFKKYADRFLLISGEEDQNVPKGISLKMAEMIDTKNFQLMPASAHMSMYEQQQRVGELVRDFAKRMQKK